MSVDWGVIWAFVWPILRQALIAFLVALLALLGYDRQVLPARLLAALKAMGFKVDPGTGRRQAPHG
jgi:hypothetical protein